MFLPIKKVMFSLISALFISFTGYSQIVKFIKNPYQAKYRVFITKQPAEANQLIFKVKGPSDIRKPGHWYVVTNPQLFSNAMTLFKVNKIEEADFVVFYVSSSDSAQIKSFYNQ